MTNQIESWMQGAFDLIKQADKHLNNGDDIDRSVAMVCFDQAIERCIKDYTKFHNIELDNETFHAKLDFLKQHIQDRKITFDVSFKDLLFYHKIRNTTYHDNNGFVPKIDVIRSARTASIEVFKVLFGVDLQEVLIVPTKVDLNPKVQFLQTYKVFYWQLYFLHEKNTGMPPYNWDGLWTMLKEIANLDEEQEILLADARRIRTLLDYGEQLDISDDELSELNIKLKLLTQSVSKLEDSIERYDPLVEYRIVDDIVRVSLREFEHCIAFFISSYWFFEARRGKESLDPSEIVQEIEKLYSNEELHFSEHRLNGNDDEVNDEKYIYLYSPEYEPKENMSLDFKTVHEVVDYEQIQEYYHWTKQSGGYFRFAALPYAVEKGMYFTLKSDPAHKVDVRDEVKEYE